MVKTFVYKIEEELVYVVACLSWDMILYKIYLIYLIYFIFLKAYNNLYCYSSARWKNPLG